MSFLTSGDELYLPAGLRKNGGWHLFTNWYLRGWTPLPYQYAYHHARQANSSFKAGIAAGFCYAGS